MIRIDAENARLQSRTNYLIAAGALKRGWGVTVPYLPSPHMVIARGDGSPELHVFSATPPTTSYADAHFVDNKYGTYKLLESNGIEQLDTALLSRDGDNTEVIKDLLGQYEKIVIKPIDGGHGRGISVDVSSLGEAMEAIEHAAANSRSSQKVIAQQQFMLSDIRDLRVLTIGRKFIAALERIPARVRGDGTHTIEELILLENQKDYRGKPYYAKLATIDIARSKEYLGDAFTTIPSAGMEVTVLGVANYGAGGELRDCTDQIPDWMKEESERASELLGLDVAGVDYLTDGPLRSDTPHGSCRAVISEVNKCPALSIHDFPTEGKSRGATEAYLDFIAQL